MSDSQPIDYFHRRAEEEGLAAERARDSRAAKSHRELARRYGEMAKAKPGRTPAEKPEIANALAREFQILP